MKQKDFFPKRAYLLIFLILGGLFAIGWKAGEVQIVHRDQYLALAHKQYFHKVTLPPRRGIIYDRKGKELGVSVRTHSLYANPRQIKDRRKVARLLAPRIGRPRGEIEKLLRTPRYFVWLKRKLTPSQKEEIEALKIKGIGFLPENRRFYPYRELAASLIGFVGTDSQGLEGLERTYERWLRAAPKTLILDKDALGNWIFLPTLEERPSPYDIHLTIDVNVQYMLEKELKRGIIETEAKGGVGIVVDPWKGEILAMATLPSFNPNLFQNYPRSRWRNRAVADLFEPGSLIKAFLVAAAIEEGLVRERDIFFCERGRYRVGDVIIHDAKPHRWLDIRRIIQYSSNIGAVKIGEVLGPYKYYHYLRRFGFGERTGVDLIGEEEGILRPARRWTRVDLATLCFGQGLSATPLQLAMAFSAIANGGKLMRPYVVRSITDRQGRMVKEGGPRVKRRVIGEATSKAILSFMKSVVSAEGTGREARVMGYAIAGKTGTAQKYDPALGRYSDERFVASFVGVLPADDPKAVVLIMLDEPSNHAHGGTAAAPVFRRLAEGLIKYWGIPPQLRLASRIEPLPSSPHWRERRRTYRDPSRMPDLRGLSVRRALKLLEGKGVIPIVEGWGLLQDQDPPPGKKLRRGQRVWLRFSPKWSSGS